jgi:hypothetical protein
MERRKQAILALWIKATNEQRSEGSFAGCPVLSYQKYLSYQKHIVLPALNPQGEALRC